MEKTEKRRVSAGKILSSVIIVVLVFVAAVLAYDRFVRKSAIPSFFGKSLLVIATPSMSGSIEAGDAIIIEKSDSYEVGDIITYFPAGENTSVTHRLVRIEGERRPRSRIRFADSRQSNGQNQKIGNTDRMAAFVAGNSLPCRGGRRCRGDSNGGRKARKFGAGRRYARRKRNGERQ